MFIASGYNTIATVKRRVERADFQWWGKIAKVWDRKPLRSRSFIDRGHFGSLDWKKTRGWVERPFPHFGGDMSNLWAKPAVVGAWGGRFTVNHFQRIHHGGH